MEINDAVVIPLVGGERLVSAAGVLMRLNGAGAVITRIEPGDITGVRRGGSDLVITRRESDPVVVTAAQLSDAQRLIDVLNAQQATAEPARNWWWRWR